jgi:hypothetical protein
MTARVRSIFTPKRALRRSRRGRLRRRQRDPLEFRSRTNAEGFEPTPEDFETIRTNIVKAGIVGRLVAKDFSGAMVWADLVPETRG